MISQLTGTQPLYATEKYAQKSKSCPLRLGTGKGDSASFSDEAYAALEASRKQKSQENTLVSQFSSTSGAASATSQKPDSADVEQKENSLLAELQEYIKNPVLKQALDKMKQAVEGMGFDDYTEKMVLEQVETAFRSGIPAEGEQTNDVMESLKKNIKNTTGLSDIDISRVMEKISFIVADAQKHDPGATKEGAEQQAAKASTEQ